MVNKCSVIGCKSLYLKKGDAKVRLHRFPLTNPKTLPLWIAATGRENGWKPCKSSRLCGNHFENSEYMVGHGKNVLKPTSVPTIDYRVDILRYNRKKSLGSCYDMERMNKTNSSDTYVEIVKPDYNDHEESYYENENDEDTKKNEHPHFTNLENSCDNGDTNLENSCDNGDDSSHDDALKNEYEDFNYKLKNDVCNRKNQCYMFTSSFKEGAEPLVLTPPEEPLNMNIDQTTADLYFKKIMALKCKKQRRTKDIYALYFKALKKRKFRKEEKYKNSFDNDDADSFAAFIGIQLKDLRPYRKVYLSAKHKIKKILMKAQLKIAN